MRLAARLLPVIALCACAAAVAQKAERPVLKPGDRWAFAVWYTIPTTEPSRTWNITSVGTDVVEGTENGDPLRLTADLNVLASPRERHSNPNALRFPLEVGRAWGYADEWYFAGTGGNGTADASVEVAAFEKVSVPAGEFEAFRLVRKDKLAGRSPKGSLYDAEIVTTYWYAPAARAIVKSESRNPYIGPVNVELTGYFPAK